MLSHMVRATLLTKGNLHASTVQGLHQIKYLCRTTLCAICPNVAAAAPEQESNSNACCAKVSAIRLDMDSLTAVTARYVSTQAAGHPIQRAVVCDERLLCRQAVACNTLRHYKGSCSNVYPQSTNHRRGNCALTCSAVWPALCQPSSAAARNAFQPGQYDTHT
jgi:hypothetical protein